MRPLIRGLFVLSVFAVLAAHVSTGVLAGMVEGFAPRLVLLLDRALFIALVRPMGQEAAVYALLIIGAGLAIWSYASAAAAAKMGKVERHSTW